jgi:ferredoxin
MRKHIEESQLHNCLKEFYIDPDCCIGCGVCSRNCPTVAITGSRKMAHFINQEQCIQCGVCLSKCKFSAVKTQDLQIEKNSGEMVLCPNCGRTIATKQRIAYILTKTMSKVNVEILCDCCRKKELVKKLVEHCS